MSEMKTANPIRDVYTRIRCPDCDENVSHRYDCHCKNMWDYCDHSGAGDCDYFFCNGCGQEKKVSWTDEEPMAAQSIFGGDTIAFDSLTEGQKANVGFNLGKLEPNSAERKALEQLFSRIATPPSGERPKLGCGYTSGETVAYEPSTPLTSADQGPLNRTTRMPNISL